MNSWDNIDRRMGPVDTGAETGAESFAPFDVPTPIQVEGAPPVIPIYEPLSAPVSEVLPALLPESEPEPDEWTAEDEFNPRFCPSCHRKIPIIVSERQEMCNACLTGRNIAVQPLPATGSPFVDAGPPVIHCPMCAGTDVEREWKNDWVSTAVDIVSDAAALGTMLINRVNAYGASGNVDWNRDVGRVKVMRHRCLSCGHRWID